ncbi:Follistatin-A [Folsomia candida]|uniref:Follistatin-A n=1 Tax=Folsomia candida TaxID=158441 RepID=A0A226F2B0_FOLCA|nr:Follistatin-A [Folsomia candida]
MFTARQQIRMVRRTQILRSHIMFALILGLLSETHWVLGGNCWLNVNKNGRCTALVKTGSTKEDCCNSGPLAATASVAWNEDELTPSYLFYMHVQGGVGCTRCKDSCDGIKCQENQKCVVRNGVPKCICSPNCSSLRLQNGTKKGRVRGPVCGSDGRTYKTPCRLLKRSCRRRVAISISYYGSCRMTCSKLTCPGKKQCLLDQNSIPHCVNCTTRHCPVANGKSVCGVNGVTYPNVCQLRQTACQKGKAIQVAYKGPCKKRASCANVKCSDGQSCLVDRADKPRCVTCGPRPKWCRASKRDGSIKGPICATNGKTYGNWCDMVEDSCSSGIALDTNHFGKCGTSTTTMSTFSNNTLY